MILLLTILINSVEAIIEALIEKYNDKLSKKIRSVHLLIVALVFALWFVLVNGTSSIPLWKLITGFVFIRFAIYDLVWNITTKLCGTNIPITYYGTTKLYDRLMTRLGSFGWWLKICAGVVGTAFLLGLK